MDDTTRLGLRERYGGYALVTGGARGIGKSFAQYLAADGFDVLLVDRDAEETEALANQLREEHRVDAQAIICDLAESDVAQQANEWASRFDIGVLVNNAGISPMDPFLDIPLADHLATLDINCRATLVLTHTIGRAMLKRERSAVVIVSSASAIGGAPFFAHYTATKGYGLNLAASLWSELKGSGIDVLAVCPGLTNTAPVQRRELDKTVPFYIPLTGPEPVALGALRALGRQPVVIPTLADRLSSAVTSRLLPRSWTLSLVRSSMNRLRGAKKDG